MSVYSLLWPIHAVLMGVSFLGILTASFIARYGTKKRWWFSVHKGINIGSASGVAAAIGIAAVMISLTHGYHLSNLHAITGLITFMLIILTPVQGFGIRSEKVKPEIKKKLRIAHRWSGRITLLLMAVTIYFGLTLAGIV